MAADPYRLLAWLPVDRFRHPPPVVAVLRLAGVISGLSHPLRGGAFSLASVAGAIERAFALPRLKAVALAINSPGGSPVQSALIAGRIRHLAAEKKVPVFAFVEDVAASGGYWLALAADEIHADASSIVGSVGVISAGFGFTGLLERLGIERRVHTQGEKKSMLDPFTPEKADDVARLERIQRQMHERFIAVVRERRAGRLAQPEDPDLFTGEFWIGTRAKELGLIDGIGDLRSVLRARYGETVVLKPIGGARPWWRRRLGMTAGASSLDPPGPAVPGLGSEWLAAIEARALWSRYGL